MFPPRILYDKELDHRADSLLHNLPQVTAPSRRIPSPKKSRQWPFLHHPPPDIIPLRIVLAHPPPPLRSIRFAVRPEQVRVDPLVILVPCHEAMAPVSLAAQARADARLAQIGQLPDQTVLPARRSGAEEAHAEHAVPAEHFQHAATHLSRLRVADGHPLDIEVATVARGCQWVLPGV